MNNSTTPPPPPQFNNDENIIRNNDDGFFTYNGDDDNYYLYFCDGDGENCVFYYTLPEEIVAFAILTIWAYLIPHMYIDYSYIWIGLQEKLQVLLKQQQQQQPQSPTNALSPASQKVTASTNDSSLAISPTSETDNANSSNNTTTNNNNENSNRGSVNNDTESGTVHANTNKLDSDDDDAHVLLSKQSSVVLPPAPLSSPFRSLHDYEYELPDSDNDDSDNEAAVAAAASSPPPPRLRRQQTTDSDGNNVLRPTHILLQRTQILLGRRFLINLVCTIIVGLLSTILIGSLTQGLDRRAANIVIGSSRIFASIIFFLLSYNFCQWLGLYRLFRPQDALERQVHDFQSIRQVRFHLSWQMWTRQFVSMYFFLLYFSNFTSRGAAGIGVIVGLTMGVIFVLLLRQARTAWRKHRTKIGIILATSCWIVSIFCMIIGIQYIEDVWLEDHSEEKYLYDWDNATFTAVFCGLWGAVTVVLHGVAIWWTRRIDKRHSALKTRKSIMRLDHRYRSELFLNQSPTSVVDPTKAKNDDWSTSRVESPSHPKEEQKSDPEGQTQQEIQSVDKESNTSTRIGRDTILEDSIQPTTTTTSSSSSSSPAGVIAADAPADSVENPRNQDENDDEKQYGTEIEYTGEGLRVLEESDTNPASSTPATVLYPLDANINDDHLSGRSNNKSENQTHRTTHEAGYAAVQDFLSNTYAPSFWWLFRKYMRLEFSICCCKCCPCTCCQSPEMSTANDDDMPENGDEPDFDDGNDDNDDARIGRNNNSASVTSLSPNEGSSSLKMISDAMGSDRQHPAGQQQKETPLERRWKWYDRFKGFLWWVVSMLFLYMTIVNIGATNQQNIVRSRLNATFELLYPPNYQTGPMCAWNESSPEGNIMSFESLQDVNDANFTVIHCGSCGNCSNWNDLELQWTTRTFLAEVSKRCAQRSLFGGSFEDVQRCNHEDIGFTWDCSWCWTVDELCAKKNCFWIFLQSIFINAVSDFRVGPDDVTSATCDEAICGPDFVPCSGATRRRMNIKSDIERPPEQQCTVAQEDWAVVFDSP